jgi:hypothetical protein
MYIHRIIIIINFLFSSHINKRTQYERPTSLCGLVGSNGNGPAASKHVGHQQQQQPTTSNGQQQQKNGSGNGGGSGFAQQQWRQQQQQQQSGINGQMVDYNF